MSIPSLIVFTESGEIYACGLGEQGQLGLGGLANKLAPTRVETSEIMEAGRGASIACGYLRCPFVMDIFLITKILSYGLVYRIW